jgi:hypothetical protein
MGPYPEGRCQFLNPAVVGNRFASLHLFNPRCVNKVLTSYQRVNNNTTIETKKEAQAIRLCILNEVIQMGILDSIKKPDDGPIICTITGDPGTGKTRLAATFPKPIFIRAEDGMKSIPMDVRPDAFPLLTKVELLWQQMTALIMEEHEYKTLVIDSVTQLEALFTDYIIEQDPKKPKSLATALGGYGAGYGALSTLHGRVRKAAGMLNEIKGMNVVFIAHSETTTVEPPDSDPYTRYELRIHKKSSQHYTDNVDLVGHLKLETFTRGDGERKKAVSTDSRVLVVKSAAAQVSKNRLSITEDLPVAEGENPLLDHIN